MAEPYLADIVGNFQRGTALGTAQRQEREAQQRQSRLSELASLAYGAQGPERQAAIGQAYGVDPKFAADLSGQLGKEDEASRARLLATAKLIKAAPPEQKEAIFQRVRPALSNDLPNLPLNYNDQVGQGIDAYITAYGGGGAGDVKVVGNSLVDTSGNVLYQAPQRFQTDTGLIEVGPGGAREITLGPSAPAQGAVVTHPQTGERGRYSIGADGQPVFIAEGIAPNVEQTIQANPADVAAGGVVEGTPQYVGGQSGRILPPGTTLRQQQLAQQQAYQAQANARAERADQRAADAAKRAAEAAQAKGAVGKPLTTSTIDKLTKDSARLDNLTELSSGFRDEFAGNVVGGSVENFIGRNAPSALTPQATQDQASWWQRYDRIKNEVRNELFGASLTAGEKAAFEAADITPNNTPDLIRKNLRTQEEIIRKGLERRAKTWAAQGYNRDAIEQASGIQLGQDQPTEGQPPAANGIRAGATKTAVNPQTGQRLYLINGQWVP